MAHRRVINKPGANKHRAICSSVVDKEKERNKYLIHCGFFFWGGGGALRSFRRVAATMMSFKDTSKDSFLGGEEA
jgi:hypothetical protein